MDFERTSFEKKPEIDEKKNEENLRFAQGNITEDEMKEYWKNPNRLLFEQEVISEKNGKIEKNICRCYGLTERFKESLLEAMKKSKWDKLSLEELEEEIDDYFEQESQKGLYNVEYYVAANENDQPFGLIGISTADIRGGAGLKTRDQLDLSRHGHNMAVILGWYAISNQYERKGLGEFLLDWIEKMSKSRGATIIVDEPSDFPGEEPARRLFEKRGYQQGFDVEDYFGPGRDLVTYFSDISGEEIENLGGYEKITEQNGQEILELGKKIFSPERQDELKVCLNLFLEQPEGGLKMDKGMGAVLRNSQNQVEGFVILSYGIYGNAIFVNWEGADPDNPKAKKNLIDSIKKIAKTENKDIIVVMREGTDESFLKEGFKSGRQGIGPNFYTKGDESVYLMYTKKL